MKIIDYGGAHIALGTIFAYHCTHSECITVSCPSRISLTVFGIVVNYNDWFFWKFSKKLQCRLYFFLNEIAEADKNSIFVYFGMSSLIN